MPQIDSLSISASSHEVGHMSLDWVLDGRSRIFICIAAFVTFIKSYILRDRRTECWLGMYWCRYQEKGHVSEVWEVVLGTRPLLSKRTFRRQSWVLQFWSSVYVERYQHFFFFFFCMWCWSKLTFSWILMKTLPCIRKPSKQPSDSASGKKKKSLLRSSLVLFKSWWSIWKSFQPHVN